MTGEKQPGQGESQQDATIEYVTVGHVDDWADDRPRAVEVGDRVVAVFRHKGQFFAIDDMCPHMGASLAAGHFDPETMTVACPWHGWRFDVRDGTWCDNRRIKTDAFPVRVIDGNVQVGVPADSKPRWKSVSTFPGSADSPESKSTAAADKSCEAKKTADDPIPDNESQEPDTSMGPDTTEFKP